MEKDGIKTVLNKYMGKIKIVAIVILIIVFLGILWKEILYNETEYREDDYTSTNWVVDDYTSNVTINEDGTINLDQTPEELWNEMIENGNNVDQYLTDYTELAKLMYAELITSYVDTRENPEEEITNWDEMFESNQFVGLIKIKRQLSDNTTIYMTYIDEETYESYKEAYLNSGSDDDKQNLIEHFTITTTETSSENDDGETETEIEEYVTYASFSETDITVETDDPDVENSYTEEYSIIEKTIDYKSLVEMYSMPFDLLWDLLVVSTDKDFVMELADLVYESEMEITVFESYREYTTINTYNYTENTKIEIDTYVGGRYYMGDTESGTGTYNYEYKEEYNYEENYQIDYFVKTTEVNKINSVQHELTKANIWLLEYEKEYNYNQITIEDTTVYADPVYLDDIDDGNYITTISYNDSNDVEGRIAALRAALINECSYYENDIEWTRTEQTTRTYYTTINREENVTTYNWGNTYTAGTVTEREKTDKEPEDIEEENFVTLLLASETAKSSIRELDEWLFEIIEENPNISDWIDTIKYLLYKTYDDDSYGVTEFDWSLFSNSTTVSSSTNLRDYIRYFENGSGAPTNADGTMYIVEDDGAGNPVVGYGVDIYNSGYYDLFIDAGYSVSIGSEIDVDFVDGLEQMEIDSCRESIVSITSGLDLTGYQIDALISRAYNCGVAGALTVLRGSPSMNFVNSYNTYWSSDDDQYEERDSNADFTHSMYTQYMSKPNTSGGNYMAGLETRRKSEWTLFQTGYYDVLDTWYSESGDLVQAAEDYFNYIDSNGWHYTLDSSQLTSGDIEKGAYTNPNKGTCCATFVNSILYTAGYIPEDIMNSFGYNSSLASVEFYKDVLGWEVIYDYNDLQPGDIGFRTRTNGGHVQMYAGDGTWYNMGDNVHFTYDQPYQSTMSPFEYAIRPTPVQ